MKSFSTLVSVAAVVASGLAQEIAVDLKSAASFALVAVGGITNTGASAPIIGNVATTGHNITGLAPGAIVGDAFERDATADQAHADALAVWTQLHPLQGQQVVATDDGTITVTKGSGDLSGNGTTNVTGAVFTPGIYNIFSILTVITNLTLSGEGQYIFTTDSHLRLNPGASIILTNGATADNVFWATGDSSTFGAGATFLGKLFSFSAITLQLGASAVGGLYSAGSVALFDAPITLLP